MPLKFLKYELRTTSETRNGINEQQVTSNWFTANEINVSHFFVQRSSNGKDFTIIGKVNAKGLSYNEYSYVDNSPLVEGLGVVYYRILSVDKDGKTSFSEVRELIINSSSLNINIYPNPVTNGSFTVTLPKSSANEALNWFITVTDVYGKVVLEKQVAAAESKFSINAPNGLYIATLFNKASGKQLTNKIVVQ